MLKGQLTYKDSNMDLQLIGIGALLLTALFLTVLMLSALMLSSLISEREESGQSADQETEVPAVAQLRGEPATES